MSDQVDKLERGPVLALDELLKKCGVGKPGKPTGAKKPRVSGPAIESEGATDAAA
jgi:hypothetical protein